MRVFVRHCNYSPSSANKQRYSWFSHEKCFKNLLEVFKDHSITVFFDGDPTNHFVSKYSGFTIKSYDQGGTDGKSLKGLLEYIRSLNIPNDEIIYVCEDDYIHRPGAPEKIIEGISIGADYVTLYDHPDKYDPYYNSIHLQGIDFRTQIVVGPTTHWKTAPSTTSTYVCKSSTLKKDFDVHMKYLDRDHHRFLDLLVNHKRSLITPLPGWSTHCETHLLSPLIDWESVLRST
jgi:hypothetical protein